MRRRERQGIGLDLPHHLWVDRVSADPRVWKRQRFEWARLHSWPPGGVGYLPFFRETQRAFLAEMARKW